MVLIINILINRFDTFIPKINPKTHQSILKKLSDTDL